MVFFLFVQVIPSLFLIAQIKSYRKIYKLMIIIPPKKKVTHYHSMDFYPFFIGREPTT